MSEHVWAKVYLELPADPKLVGRSAHDCYLWVCLILISKPQDGMVPPWQAQAKYLSKYARVSLKEVVAGLSYFADVGMIKTTPDGGFILPNFARRQKRHEDSAAVAQRQAARRDRERSHAPVTQESRKNHAHRTPEEADRSPNGLLAEAESRGRKESPSGDACIPQIFTAYQAAIRPEARLIDAARDKIRTRLKTFTTDDLLLAIRNFSGDSWQMENNAHRGAAWFFDSDKRTEQYLNLTPRTEPSYTEPGQRRPDGKIQVQI